MSTHIYIQAVLQNMTKEMSGPSSSNGRAFGMNPMVVDSSSPSVETFYVSKYSALFEEHAFVSR